MLAQTIPIFAALSTPKRSTLCYVGAVSHTHPKACYIFWLDCTFAPSTIGPSFFCSGFRIQKRYNIGASITSIGFGAHYTIIRMGNPQNSMGRYLGPYIMTDVLQQAQHGWIRDLGFLFGILRLSNKYKSPVVFVVNKTGPEI